ncbi:MAG TPA: hypothetical protein VIL69_12065, partial [Roseomonas sp.]
MDLRVAAASGPAEGSADRPLPLPLPRPGLKTPPMRVLFVANVDFALRHFILPLMRGARARGHEVVAASAEGPLLDLPRAEGFTVFPMPVARSLSPRANWRA